MAQADDGRHHLAALPVGGQALDQATIDLQFVEAEAAQPHHAGESGAEVVQSHADAVGFQIAESPFRGGFVLDQFVLGHLDADAVQRERRLGHRLQQQAHRRCVL